VSAGVEFRADGFGRAGNRWLRVSHRPLRPAPAGHDQDDDEGDDQEYGGAGERSRHAVGQGLAASRLASSPAAGWDDPWVLAAANTEVKMPSPRSSSFCVMVGCCDREAGGLLANPSAGAWSTADPPVPAGVSADDVLALGGVSCAPEALCVAVGEYDNSASGRGLILTSSP
jgi:hypothetical protein